MISHTESLVHVNRAWLQLKISESRTSIIRQMMDTHTKKYYKEKIIMKRWRNNNEINGLFGKDENIYSSITLKDCGLDPESNFMQAPEC